MIEIDPRLTMTHTTTMVPPKKICEQATGPRFKIRGVRSSDPMRMRSVVYAYVYSDDRLDDLFRPCPSLVHPPTTATETQVIIHRQQTTDNKRQTTTEASNHHVGIAARPQKPPWSHPVVWQGVREGARCLALAVLVLVRVPALACHGKCAGSFL